MAVHIAFMKKSWGFTEKVLRGEKTIESRWYMVKTKPWNVIKKGDTVYFKDTGEPVTIKAEVQKVEQYADLNTKKVSKLLEIYGEAIGISKEQIPVFAKQFKNKKYCVLVFLTKVQKVSPFHVNKKGFGAMAAWITVGDINSVKTNQ